MLENIYENCKCRKKLMFKLVEELNENIDGNEMIYNGNLNDYEKEWILVQYNLYCLSLHF